MMNHVDRPKPPTVKQAMVPIVNVIYKNEAEKNGCYRVNGQTSARAG
jgi:hypothetical protein